MSVEIAFPLEFIVGGTPVSLQTKRREALTEWKARIIAASQPALPEGHFAAEGALAITLFYFPPSEMEGDLDNIVKPILDAMTRHVYISDQQINRLVVQKFEPGNIFGFANPTATLDQAMSGTKPLLYVRLSDDPFEDLA